MEVFEKIYVLVYERFYPTLLGMWDICTLTLRDVTAGSWLEQLIPGIVNWLNTNPIGELSVLALMLGSGFAIFIAVGLINFIRNLF